MMAPLMRELRIAAIAALTFIPALLLGPVVQGLSDQLY